MLTNESAPHGGKTRQYLVKCEGCSFEHPTDERDDAARIGTDHHRETGHEVVAVEVPPSIGSA